MRYRCSRCLKWFGKNNGEEPKRCSICGTEHYGWRYEDYWREMRRHEKAMIKITRELKNEIT